jgi:hypothetical protein
VLNAYDDNKTNFGQRHRLTTRIQKVYAAPDINQLVNDELDKRKGDMMITGEHSISYGGKD